MNILQKPDSLSLSMNLKKFIIGAQQSVSFVLYNRNVELLSQSYVPGVNGTIEIDIRDIVHSQLFYQLKDSGQVYEQIGLVSDFKAVIDGTTEIPFRVVRAGVDRLADSATNFLTQNFLTWQPSIKPVTYYSPEFLTYYAVVSGTAKLCAYFTDEAGNETSQKEHTITEVMAGIAYTMPLQYSVVSGWLDHQLPAYYDVWIEDAAGNRLTYIQRYYADAVQSSEEDWVLFENSLGGLDTFRAYGSSTLKAEHTHNLAEIDKDSLEYRVDTSRQYQKNTGHLDRRQSRWLLDFFPSQKKYIYTESYIRQIVVIDSDVTANLRTLPSSYTFTYKFADARPLLNLTRTDVPADMLNITVPEVGSFTVPPRLAEFSRLSLSEGALFPVQNPYSEQWATTTVDAIGDFLAIFLAQGYGSDGGVGHKHRNYSLLELLSYVEGYLLVNGQKIKAGYADKAGSVDGMDDVFLHKNKADGTPFTLTIGKDLKFGDFISMIRGGYVDAAGDAELNSLVLRDHLSVPEIRFNRMTYFEGYNLISPGGGFKIKEVTDNEDGTYTIIPDLEDGEPLGQYVDDIYLGYWHNKTASGDFAGFQKVQFRATSVDYEAKTFVLAPRPETNAVPLKNMRLGQTGNFTNPERQTYTIIDTRDGNNCITFYDNANTWDVEPAQEKSWFGKKKGRTVHGIPADNYSAVLRDIIMSGKIFQVDDITGEAFRVPLNKGAWEKGVKYAYYDEVSHDGSSWLCLNDKGTTSEPKKGNPDWLEYVSKGTSGKGISSTDVEFALSSSSAIAPTTGWQTTSPTWENGKYIWSRTKIVFTDEEVKYTNPACITGGQGADGKGIKSIVEEYYLSSSSSTTTGGTWQTSSPAWKNGWYIWTRTKITYTDDTSSTTNAICVTGGKGADGTSITSCGDWHTGLHVPYMGLVKMGGRVFLCKKEGGTDNPPMWTRTTKDGNRILQTQDGGKSYGYVITGDLNTAEYELLVSNGQDGKDGKDYEWIFKHTTDNVPPPTPGTSQVDDYVPAGWHDDAIGVSESLPYEWACCRTKKDNVWSAFTPAALWAKFGFDGESVVIADFDNEMVNAALNSKGVTTSAQSWTTIVTMSYGTEKMTLDSITCTPGTGLTCMTNKNTGEVTVAVASGVALKDTNAVNITVRASKNGQQYTRNLVFTVAGIRGGANGADAVLYSIVPSVSSVKKDKAGKYSVASVSCRRIKTVGGVISDTTEGELKYSINGGAEVSIGNNVGVASSSFSQSLKFIFYVGGKVVDVETIPMLIDGGDGGKGEPGTSIKAGGEWRTANTPYAALTIVTMGGHSWLSKVATSNPPIGTVTTNDGRRITQTQDGGKSYGYILREGAGSTNTAEWELLTSDGSMVYLITTVGNIRVSNAGSLVPSAFKVYAKRSLGSATLTYSDGYLAARGYSNGIWTSIAGPSRSSELTVNASAGYSTFSVRCYQTQADAAAWNDSFIAEASVGVCYDGEKGGDGRTGSEPRPRGLFAKGSTYVWDEKYHDIVLATFNNRTVPFRVRAYGASVTAAPTSIDGDANWESAQQFQFVATDLLLSRQIRADEIYADGLKVTNGTFYGSISTPSVIVNGEGNTNLDFSTGFNFAAFANTGARDFVLPNDGKYNGVLCTITHLGGENINITVVNGTMRCGKHVISKITLPGYGIVMLYSVQPSPGSVIIWHIVNNSSFTYNSLGSIGTATFT